MSKGEKIFEEKTKLSKMTKWSKSQRDSWVRENVLPNNAYYELEFPKVLFFYLMFHYHIFFYSDCYHTYIIILHFRS